MVCPTKLQLRTNFGAHPAALVSIHCRFTMNPASPCLSPPAAKYFLSYFHSSWPNSSPLPAEIPCLQSQSHFSQLASCSKTFHTFILDFSVQVSAIYFSENCTHFPPWKGCLSFPSPPRLLCSLCKDSVLSSPLIQVDAPKSWSFSNHLHLPQCHPLLSSVYLCFPFFPSFLLWCSSFSLHSTVMLQSFLIQISYAPLASMCLYVFSFVFLFFIYV